MNFELTTGDNRTLPLETLEATPVGTKVLDGQNVNYADLYNAVKRDLGCILVDCTKDGYAVDLETVGNWHFVPETVYQCGDRFLVEYGLEERL